MKLKKILLGALLLTFLCSCVSGKAVHAMESKKVVLNTLPKSAAEIKPASSPQQTAAYAIASLVRYTEDAEAGIAMLDVLRGPRPLNNFNKQFLRDQLRGKEYTARSYFDGANPDNNYTPSTPYTLTVSENPYSYQNEGYARLLLKSGGADNPRLNLQRASGICGSMKDCWRGSGFRQKTIRGNKKVIRLWEIPKNETTRVVAHGCNPVSLKKVKKVSHLFPCNYNCIVI